MTNDSKMREIIEKYHSKEGCSNGKTCVACSIWLEFDELNLFEELSSLRLEVERLTEINKKYHPDYKEVSSLRSKLEMAKEALKKIRDWNPKQPLPAVWEIAADALVATHLQNEKS